MTTTTCPRRTTAAAFAAGIALMLSACGGGGGSDTPVVPSATRLTGAAVKGVIRNADVTVIELVNNLSGSDGRVVGTGTTTNAGAYEVSFTDYRGGPVRINVVGRADGTTRVVCDYRIGAPGDDCGTGIAFGDDIPVDVNFSLSSLASTLNAAGSGAATFNVTALSALITTLAESASTGTAAERIRTATFLANQFAGGVDVTRTTPVDLTSPAAIAAATGDSLAYSALNAAVLSLATAGTPQASISAAVATLAGQIAGGTLSNQTLHDLIDTAQQQLTAAGGVDTGGLLVALDETTGCSDGSTCTGLYELADAPPTLNASAVARAKAFSTDIRTSIENYEDAFDPDSNVFVGRVRDVGEFSGDAATDLVGDIADAIDQAISLRDDGVTSGTITGFTSAGAVTSATYTATISGGNETYRIVGAVDDATVDITGVLPARNAGGDIVGTNLAASISGTARTTSGAGLSLAITTGTASVVRRDGTVPLEEELPGGRNFDRASIDVTATLAQINVSNPLSFTGQVSVDAVQCNTAACAGGTADSGAIIATPTSVELNGTLTDSTGNTVAGTFAVAVPEATARRFNYDADYSSTNFVDGTVTISARTALINPVPPVDEARVTLAFTSTGYSDDKDYPIGNATLTFVRGSTTLFRVTGSNSAAAPDLTRLDITGTGDVAITLNNIAADPSEDVVLSGEVRVDGQRAGVIQQLDSGLVRVVYDDGSFETLFN